MELCPACGASWECEHQPDSDRVRLVYVAPDADNWRDGFEKVLAAFNEWIAGMKQAWEILAQAILEAATTIVDTMLPVLEELQRKHPELFEQPV